MTRIRDRSRHEQILSGMPYWTAETIHDLNRPRALSPIHMTCRIAQTVRSDKESCAIPSTNPACVLPSYVGWTLLPGRLLEFYHACGRSPAMHRLHQPGSVSFRPQATRQDILSLKPLQPGSLIEFPRTSDRPFHASRAAVMMPVYKHVPIVAGQVRLCRLVDPQTSNHNDKAVVLKLRTFTVEELTEPYVALSYTW